MIALCRSLEDVHACRLCPMFDVLIQQGNEPTSTRMRGTRSSSDAGSRRLCRETPAATRRRFDLLCREVHANRARLQALNGSTARGMDCKLGNRYAEIPDYANVNPSVREGGTISAIDPGVEGVTGELGGILCSEGGVSKSRRYPTREADLEALRRNRKLLADCNSTLDQMMNGWRVPASQSSERPERRPSSPRNASKPASTPLAKTQRPCRSSCARARGGGAAASGSGMRGAGARTKRRSSNDAGSPSSRMASARPTSATTSNTLQSCRYRRDVSPKMATCPLETATCALPGCVYFPEPPSTVTPALPPPQGVSRSPSKSPSRPIEFFPGAYRAMFPPKAGNVSTKPVASSGGDREDRCFPPPVPLPRPDGNVLQEARAYAPAQHLAVLRALLNDGAEGTTDDEAGIQDEVVGCSDDSEWEDEGVSGSSGQGGRVERQDKGQLETLAVGHKNAIDRFCA